MSRYTHPPLRPVRDTVTAPDLVYRRGDGAEVQITRIDTRHVYTRVVVCPCRTLGAIESDICEGHRLGQFIRWDWALWRTHCADGWIRQLDREARA